MSINETFLRHLDLQLFAEGAGDGGTGAEGAKGETGAAAMSQTQITDSDGTTAQVIDRKAEFEKLIKGEYKDLYDERVQDTVQKRVKGLKEKEGKLDALTPTLETLAKKYGVDASDIEALNKAIEEDDAYYEEEALEKGLTVQQLKEIRKMERENADLKKQMEAQRNKENADKLVASWMEQSEQVKYLYPSFDLKTEMQNPKFTQFLGVPGVDVQTAYELAHKGEIFAGLMHHTAKTVEKKVTDKIIANGARPSENGLNSQSAALTNKSDVSQLSKADILRIQREVAQGGRVDFTRR